ncbi:MAG: hypothetical protein BWY26_01528 [Elusimicrobia bacterium ADurb.Bin231]|nr:MAG: hypothetical protein BWY26_01528 [Elusimicrobia bacterium ADurb.Bin231]
MLVEPLFSMARSFERLQNTIDIKMEIFKKVIAVKLEGRLIFESTAYFVSVKRDTIEKIKFFLLKLCHIKRLLHRIHPRSQRNIN